MTWDDGTHAKVKKVHITYDDIIYSIEVTYDGSHQSHRRGSAGPMSAEFALESDEYITALSSYALSTKDVVTSLTFTTNKKTYGPYGNKFGYQKFDPEDTGKQIAGFHGTTDDVLNSIEVHYAPIPTVQKMDAQGGTGGTEWDDGSDHDGVTNIFLGTNENGIHHITFSYVKDGQTKHGSQHGLKDRTGHIIDIVINHPDEHLVSVEGWYDSENVILGIKFKTNQSTYDYSGYRFDGIGTKFTLQVQDKKIIGFHGFSTVYLNSIGAYFAPLSSTMTPKELEAKGGESDS